MILKFSNISRETSFLKNFVIPNALGVAQFSSNYLKYFNQDYCKTPRIVNLRSNFEQKFFLRKSQLMNTKKCLILR